MSKRILALSTGFELSDEALEYASALTRRLEGALILLMLLPLDIDGDAKGEELGRRGNEMLRQRLDELVIGDNDCEGHVRIGDPWSELCKFAALNGPFQMVVWASDSELTRERATRGGDHWARQIQRGLNCPVVTAKRRHRGRVNVDEARGSGAKKR